MTDKQRLREFLLGGLAPEDSEALEERMFADDALYREMDEERETLVEEYVGGSLPGEDAARFERQQDLSPELALRVTRLRYLKTLLKRRRGGRGSGIMEIRHLWQPLPVALAVCVLGLLIACGIQWRENRRLHAELTQKVEEPQAAPKATSVQPGGTEGVVFLAAGVVRGPQDRSRVQIAPGTSLVQLQIEVHEGTASPANWAVEVSRRGQEIFRSSVVVPRRAGSISYLPVYIPGEALTEGSYSVRIQSSDPGQGDESRTFTVGRASTQSPRLK